MAEIDPNFEPQSRPRCNTWPLRPEDTSNHVKSGEESPGNESRENLDQAKQEITPKERKNTSRRNAWGNMSYADLITKAVQSSPEKRLTLSQIYEWMVKNVPYFSDKGDSNSSAGWKNSIRHNLSLHSRFMRVQNEGTGKSSWWMINPDAKPGKSSRRRASSMETNNPKWERKRGRAKKKVAALGGDIPEMSSTPTPEGEISGSPLPFINQETFRSRTGSNASNGRLSPIHPHDLNDMHDNEVPPMSPGPSDYAVPDWGNNSGLSTPTYRPISDMNRQAEQLTDTLAEMMKLSPMSNTAVDSPLGGSLDQVTPASLPPVTSQSVLYPQPGYSALPSMPSYTQYTSSQPQQQQQQQVLSPLVTMSQEISAAYRPGQNDAFAAGQPLEGGSTIFPDDLETLAQDPMLPQQPPPMRRDPMLPTLLGRGGLGGLGHQPQLPVPSTGYSPMAGSSLQSMLYANRMRAAAAAGMAPASYMQPETMPSDLDVDMFNGGLDCDMDSIIRNELDIGDGSLDFNFPESAAAVAMNSMSSAAMQPGSLQRGPSAFNGIIPSSTAQQTSKPSQWVH